MLSRLAGQIGSADVADRLAKCSRLITDATGSYANLSTRGEIFYGSSNADHLRDWAEALQGFRALAGIQRQPLVSATEGKEEERL